MVQQQHKVVTRIGIWKLSYHHRTINLIWIIIITMKWQLIW